MSNVGSPAGASALRFALTSPIWFDGQASSVGAHGVCAYVSEPSGCGRARAAGEVVALVDGDDEERVALVDAVVLQPL